MSIPLPPIDPPRAPEAPVRDAGADGWLARLVFGDVHERRGPLALTLLAVLAPVLTKIYQSQIVHALTSMEQMVR